MSYAGRSAVRNVFRTRTRVAVIALVSIAMLGTGLTLGFSSQDAQAVPPPPVEGTVCYSLDEGTGDATEDQQFLHQADFAAGAWVKSMTNGNVPPDVTDASGNIESIAVRNDASEIYAYDPAANAMFLVSGVDGSESAATDFALTGLGDVDAMFFQNDTDGDPANDILWVLIDVNDGVAGNVDNDILQSYNTAGVLQDTVTITDLPVDATIEGATWLPDTGEFFISYTVTNSTVPSTLASLGTGATPTGTHVVLGTTVADVEGFGTDGAGNLYLSTGEDGADANSIFQVDGLSDTVLVTDWTVGAPVGGDADFESVDCAFADIALSKSLTDGPTRLANGDFELEFTFIIENRGELPLDGVTLTDPFTEYNAAPINVVSTTPDDVAGDCSTAAATGTQSLNIDESCTAVWTVVVNSIPPGDYDNQASVTGTPPNGLAGPVTDLSEDDTGVNDGPANPDVDNPTPATIPPAQAPALDIVKTVAATAADCPATFADGDPTLDTLEIAEGAAVTYCINVINNGPGDAANVSIADDLDPNSPRTAGDNAVLTGGNLAAGAEDSYSYTINVGTNDEVNLAIITGTDVDGGNPSTAQDDAGTTEPPPEAPSLDIVKTVAATAADCPATFAAGDPTLDTLEIAEGEAVTYCINVINNGPGDAANVSIADDLDPNSPRTAGDNAVLTGGNLAAGAEDSYSYTINVGTNDEVNLAIITGTGTDGLNPSTAQDDAGTTEPPPEAPSLDIVKTVAATAADCPATFAEGDTTLDTLPIAEGDSVTYCINVINNGPGDAANVSIADDLDPNSPRTAGDNAVLTGGNLAAGDQDSYSYTINVGTNDEVNLAIITGTGTDGLNPSTAQDDAGTTEPIADAPNLQIRKTVVATAADCPATYADATQGLDRIEAADGATVVYCINVINLGPGAAANVSISDDFDAAAPRDTGDNGALVGGNLAANAEDSFNYSHTVGAGDETNTATVNGTDVLGNNPSTDSDQAGTTEPDPDPQDVQIRKTVVATAADCPATYAAATQGLDRIEAADGTTVVYCINVINLGPGDAANVSISDDFDADAPRDTGDNGALVGGELDANAEDSYNYTHTVGATAEVNVATVTSTDVAGGSPGTDSDNAGTTVPDPADPPSLQIRKTVVTDAALCPATYALADETLDTIPAAAGTDVVYCINAINDGPGDAQNVQIADDFDGQSPRSFAGVLAANTELAPYSYTHTVGTNPEVNVAVITGEDLDGNAATPDQDDAGTTEPAPLDPVLEIVKTVVADAALCPATFTEGTLLLDTIPAATNATVVYCINVRNTGTGDAQNVQVTDDFDATNPRVIGNVAAGTEAAPYNYTHTVGTNPEVNTATVTGENSAGAAVTPDSDDAGTTDPAAATLGNFVWRDDNRDGVQDAGEPGLANTTVQIFETDAAGNPLSNTATFTVTTDANGEWTQEVTPGAFYRVAVVLPNGASGYSPTDVGDDTTDSDAASAGPDLGFTGVYTVPAGTENLTADVGIIFPVVLSELGNFVWNDLDADGVQDTGEPGIAGITVQALDSAGNVAGTDVTDADGLYLIEDLQPGTYTVQFVNTTTGTFTGQNLGGDDTTDSDVDAGGTSDSVTLGEDDSNLTVDAGIVFPELLGSIANFVFEDTNENGLQDAGEPGVPGVVVTVVNSAGTTVGTDTTDAAGLYLVDNLPADTYTVQFVLPGTREFTTQNVDNDVSDTTDSDPDVTTGITDDIPLAAGQDRVDVDAGVLPIDDPRGGISNFVFEDTNENGLQDAGEPPVPGVTVTVFDAAGNVVGTDTTDAAGLYLVDGLVPGDYTVQFVLPGNREFTAQDAGDDTLDSDPDPTTGITDPKPVLADAINDTVDAGVLPFDDPRGGISNFVFVDANENGLQDTGEAPVAGVTVNVFDSAGQTVGTDTTDAAGLYLVDGLVPGDYTVEFILPGTLEFTAQDAGDDTLDSDPDPTTGITDPKPVVADAINDTVDAGVLPIITPVGSISNFVFVDENQNGLQDAGEPGVQGVTVVVTNSAGLTVGSDITDAAGEYLVDNLPADDYVVTFTLPGNLQFTQQNAGDDALDSDPNITTGATDPIPLGVDEDRTDVDAGVLPIIVTPVGAISNFVFVDANQNGLQDTGEAGVQGVIVTVRDAAGATVGTDITDSAGEYLVGNLPAGDYTVEFTLPGTLTFTTQDAGDDTLDSDPDPATGITDPKPVVANQTNTTVDAGVIPIDTPLGAISNFVFEDVNEDGVQDAGEPGVQGVGVEVINSAGAVVGTATTDAAGEYLVSNLVPGDYTVRFVLPGGLTFTTQDAGADDTLDSDPDPTTGVTGPKTVVANQTNDTVDAGVIAPDNPLGAISNFVFLDEDEDGVQDTGEPGIQGATVVVKDSNGLTVGTTVTDAAGLYLVDGLPAGDYTVTFTLPGGLTFTTQDAGADDTVDSDADPTTGTTGPQTVIAGQTNMTVDAGAIPLGGNDLGAISNFVFVDEDEDGVQDAGEPGVQGVVVSVINAGGTTVGTAITDAAGEYLIDNLPAGDYTVEFDLPGALQFTAQDAGGDDTLDSDPDPATGIAAAVTVTSGQTNSTVDAGVLPIDSANVGGISNVVFIDADGDGVQDAGEGGVLGVVVTVKDATGTVVGTAVTDAAGEYLVSNLPAGTYSVEFDLPGALEFTAQDQGGNDALDSDPDPATGIAAGVVVTAGTVNNTVDAGVLQITQGLLGSISNQVFLDNNSNGTQDAGEPGVEGVGVIVKDSGGNVVGTTTTNATGAYVVSGLPAGSYTVEFNLPGGLSFTTQDAGADDTVDSDPDPATGATGVIILGNGDNNTTVDAGVLPPPVGERGSISNVVFEDTNQNGIQDAGEPGVQGVVVEVFNASGLQVGSAITDASGAYLIDNLPAGDYTVKFTPPGNLTLTSANEGTDDTVDSDPDPATGITAVITLGAGENNSSVDAGVVRPDSPVIGLAKRVTAGPTENAAGNHVITYTFVIENLGTVALTDVTLADDFDATFAGATVVSGPTPNGGTCSAEAATGTATLAVGQSCVAVWDVEVMDMVPGTTYNNTATVTGNGPAGRQTSDISDDGVEPDANGNGVPNDAGEDDPTPVRIPAPPVAGPTCTSNSGTVFSGSVCPTALSYDGPYSNMPAAPTSTFSVPNVQAAEQQVPLAHTGSNSGLLATLAIALMGLGGALMIGTRRSRRDEV